MGKKDSKSLQENDYSDTKYILVLFLLALIVIIFWVLIYTFSQTPEAKTYNHREPRIESINHRPPQPARKPSTPPVEEVVTETRSATPTQPVARTFTIPSDFDANAYNLRSSESQKLYGERLIREYFAAIQENDYKKACSLTSKRICNARGDISSFQNFLNQLDGGYQLESIYESQEQKEDEKIFCVRYNYKLKADLNPSTITELFQYRVKMRPDGMDEISARVCEDVSKDGKNRPCPISTPKKYCKI